MSWILTAVILAGSPTPRAMELPVELAAPALTQELQTGSLIFSRGDCLAVKVFSASALTHVAAVVMNGGQATVYDSTGGIGVRKQSLDQYLAGQEGAIVYLFHPRRPFSANRGERFERHLESQLGKPYAIKHHLTGARANGLHCAEYVTDALIEADMLQARQPARVSPASLVAGITRAELYQNATIIQLQSRSKERPEAASWCGQLWLDTKSCTKGCYVQLRRWFCCK